MKGRNETAVAACPLPTAQVLKAGEGSLCSEEVAGCNELGEFSQRNSFAFFCFGFCRKCFLSALVDGFQTEGTLGNETEKAVTHCTWCQGMVVTHGSWRGPCTHLASAAAQSHPPGDPAGPSRPTATLGRCLPALAVPSWLTPGTGDDHLLLHASPHKVTLARAML